jgi:Family of unknown function (DUF6220)
MSEHRVTAAGGPDAAGSAAGAGPDAAAGLAGTGPDGTGPVTGGAGPAVGTGPAAGAPPEADGGGAAARRPAMTVLHWALGVFLLAGAVQIFLAGLGAFRTEKLGADTAFAVHRTFGFALGPAALVILVLALVARAGRLAVAAATVMVVLTVLAQSLLATLADHHALYGGLHAFDGLAIIGVAAWLWARTRPRAPRLPR